MSSCGLWWRRAYQSVDDLFGRTYVIPEDKSRDRDRDANEVVVVGAAADVGIKKQEGACSGFGELEGGSGDFECADAVSSFVEDSQAQIEIALGRHGDLLT